MHHKATVGNSRRFYSEEGPIHCYRWYTRDFFFGWLPPGRARKTRCLTSNTINSPLLPSAYFLRYMLRTGWVVTGARCVVAHMAGKVVFWGPAHGLFASINKRHKANVWQGEERSFLSLSNFKHHQHDHCKQRCDIPQLAVFLCKRPHKIFRNWLANWASCWTVSRNYYKNLKWTLKVP